MTTKFFAVDSVRNAMRQTDPDPSSGVINSVTGIKIDLIKIARQAME